MHTCEAKFLEKKWICSCGKVSASCGVATEDIKKNMCMPLLTSVPYPGKGGKSEEQRQKVKYVDD
jgi:hypothetical protein